jgi:hypothetical protein
MRKWPTGRLRIFLAGGSQSAKISAIFAAYSKKTIK